MGIYSSTFYKSGDQILFESTDPSQANWITAHADACKLTIPEVLRCWERFLMLHPDKNGNILRHSLTTNDAFNSQLVEQLPVSEDGLVTFQTFCCAVKWLSSSVTETKLRGFIDEDDFILWLKRLPVETLKSSLHFPVLPNKTTVTGHRTNTKHFTARTRVESTAVQKLTYNQLHVIAVELSKRRRDWKLLANCLGFLEKDCQTLERKYLDTENQILEMLQLWRRRAQVPDAAKHLQAALRDTGNADISNAVFQ
uniref:Death domain-containing protein n=1 Tax=Lepisosteus oculatus TaxID=7918 RepID=W5MXY7_LEPOC